MQSSFFERVEKKTVEESCQRSGDTGKNKVNDGSQFLNTVRRALKTAAELQLRGDAKRFSGRGDR